MDWKFVLTLYIQYADVLDSKLGHDKARVIRKYREYGLDLNDGRHVFALLRNAKLLSSIVTTVLSFMWPCENLEEIMFSQTVFRKACGRLLSELRPLLPAGVAAGTVKWEFLLDDGSWPLNGLGWSKIRPGIKRLEARHRPADFPGLGIKSRAEEVEDSYSPQAWEFAGFCYWLVLEQLRRSAVEAAIEQQCLQLLGPLSARLRVAIVAGRQMWPEIDV